MTSAKDCGRYLRAITWYMGWAYARPRVIRGTRPNHYRCFLPDLAGFAAGALHGARDLTSNHRSMWVLVQLPDPNIAHRYLRGRLDFDAEQARLVVGRFG